MNRSQFCRPLAIAALRFLCLAALAMLASGPMAGIARAAAEETDVIERVSAIDDGDKLSDGPIGLNDGVALILKGPTVPVPAEAVLYLNTHKMTGLTDVRYLPQLRALVFRLSRDASNAEAWKPVLASPSFRPFAVAVTLTKAGASGPLVVGADGKPPTIKFLLIPFPWLAASGVAVLLVIAALWAAASKTNLLKDSLLPQLSPKEQPFSLGRSQMAFWFALIFATYVFLFVALGDYNTLTNQSLALMGISGATAIFAVAVDASKDTPIGAVNETLRALGLATYGDVVRLDQEIAQRQAALVATPSLDPATILRLQTEITDRLNKKRLYHDKTRPFISDGWYRDVTTDINGPALHRLQMFVWTLTLGAVFVIEVYQTLAMPEFSATLLALMGVTSAGYIGFKYPERQN